MLIVNLTKLNSYSCILSWFSLFEGLQLNKQGSISPVKKKRLHFLVILLCSSLPTNWFKSPKQAEDLCCWCRATCAVRRLVSYMLLVTAVFCSSDLWHASTVLERFWENTVHLFVYLFHRRLFSSLTWGVCSAARSLLSPRRLKTLSVSVLLPNNSETERRPFKTQLQNKYI